MKKNFSILFLIFILFHNNTAFAEDYYFKNCKLNKNVEANYVINLNKKVIEVTLKSKNGEIQKLTDKIKLIKKDQIITEKIKSGKDKNVYFEYYLNAKKGKVIKLEYKKQADTDINIFKIKSKLLSLSFLKLNNSNSDIKGNFFFDKIIFFFKLLTKMFLNFS